nr:DUF6563 family protein [Bacteroides sp. 224]
MNQVEETSELEIKRVNPFNIKVKTTNKVLKKALKKTLPALLLNDTLYVNLRLVNELSGGNGPLGTVFTRLEERDNNFVFRVAAGKEQIEGAAFMFGLVGAAIASASYSGSFDYYLFYPERSKCQKIDSDLLIELLKSNPKLHGAYILEKKPNKKSTIIEYIERYLNQDIRE